MIVLDTNVISELMRTSPNEGVIAWMDRQPADSIWTTSICVFELRMGLNLLPDGRRRQRMEDQFQAVLEQDLAERVLDVNTSAAFAAANIAGRTRPQGITTDFRDLLIAGTVAARNATLATRNTRHFEHVGIELVNPWEPGQQESEPTC